MVRIDIRPVWRFRIGDTEREFDFQLVTILGEIDASGKLTHAAERAGLSYRHAWNLVEQWEAFFGAPLVAKEKGKGSALTPLGEGLLWAGRRAQARLAPELGNLAADFARTLDATLDETGVVLTLQASHDFAVAALRDPLAAEGLELAVQYKGSFDALSALRRGECDLAGFHVPEGRPGALMARRYAECLPPGEFRLVGFVRRIQGLIVPPGNPKRIESIADLCRPDVRMVNRQRGSGTRALLEFLVSDERLDRRRMAGYEIEEVTHGAVAAMVAGRQADAGVGVQAAAAEYRLDFIPLAVERYFLACREAFIDAPPMRRLLAFLRSGRLAEIVAALPGYASDSAGSIVAALEAGEPPPRSPATRARNRPATDPSQAPAIHQTLTRSSR